MSESTDTLFLDWKFWVFSFNGLHLITTYGMTENEARTNLQAIGDQHPDLKLNKDNASLLFTVDSPINLGETSDDMLQKLCVLVTHTIIKNDQCNQSLRDLLNNAHADAVAAADATKH